MDDEMFDRLFENIKRGIAEQDKRDAIWARLLQEDVHAFAVAAEFRWKLLVNEHNWRCRERHFSVN